jgi:hypothetical protein
MTRLRRVAVFFLALVLVVPCVVVGLFGLIVVPSWVDVETFCLLAETTHTVDVYFVSFEVVIALTAIATIGLMVAYVERIGWRFLIPPLGWLGAILLAEYLVALVISPQPCEGGIGI